MGGTLTAKSFTKSSDGSTLTAVFSDPALARQELTFVTIDPSQGTDNDCGCDVPPGGSFYFSGYTPSVTIATPGLQHHQVVTSLGTGSCGGNAGTCCPDAQYGTAPCAGLPLTATEVGLATGVYGDAAGVSSDRTTPADISWNWRPGNLESVRFGSGPRFSPYGAAPRGLSAVAKPENPTTIIGTATAVIHCGACTAATKSEARLDSRRFRR